MASVAHNGLPDKPRRIALYGRVSTEDQQERETIKAQVEFLRSFCRLYSLEIAGEYLDDGVSGALPLTDRPEGRRLLDDARAGILTEVLVYRLDRLGRTLRSLLDAHDQLSTSNVTIRSATEPFDTGTPIGKFLFQLLASLAELERATLHERMSMGRARIARAGRWVGGPVPLGYDVDASGCLVPSIRMIEALNQTEADLARDIFTHIEGGSSAIAEVRRLNLLGVPSEKRYAHGALDEHTSKFWQASRLYQMIRNPVDVGRHVFHSRGEAIEREVPALVTEVTWERAAAQLVQNRQLSKKNAKRQYLLRGLITCDRCGATYSGCVSWHSSYEFRYYRCQSVAHVTDGSRKPCGGKSVSAKKLEDAIWADCAWYVRHPGEGLQDAQRQLRQRQDQSASIDTQRRALLHQISEKEGERERILSFYRKRRITESEAEAQLDDIAQETGELRGMLEALRAQEALSEAMEAQLASAAAMLAQLQDRVDEIERTNDQGAKREVIELLVAGIKIMTTGEGAERKALPRVTYVFGEPRSLLAVSENSTGKCNRSTPGT